MSTEHTAYLRLKNGTAAPGSGSSDTNGKTVAEQIGAQIFIDGWAMVAPGDPDMAVKMATQASLVSHDGEALHGALVIAAMEAQAFVENDIHKLIAKALTYIPADSKVSEIIKDMLELHKREPDWRKAVRYLIGNYPYARYGGSCPMVPNHGLIILALLYCEDDFQRGQMIVNTGGWDTDCNAGNLGCIMGIKNGLAGIDQSADFRGPVADRLYLPTAEGGRGVGDALEVALWIINLGARLYGHEPFIPKKGAKFHFEAPGAVQGFQCVTSPDHLKSANLSNQTGISQTGLHTLSVDFCNLVPGQPLEVITPTATPAEQYGAPGYKMIACPTLYSGQQITAAVYLESDSEMPLMVSLQVTTLNAGFSDPRRLINTQHEYAHYYSDPQQVKARQWRQLSFTVPSTQGLPVTYTGLRILHPGDPQLKGAAGGKALKGTLHLDYLTWTGVPRVTLWQSGWNCYGAMSGWCSSMDDVQHRFDPVVAVKNDERGFFTKGNRAWQNYKIEGTIVPRLFEAGGLVLYYQGQRRYLALMLGADGKLRLEECIGEPKVLAESSYELEWNQQYHITLESVDDIIKGGIVGQPHLEGRKVNMALSGGGCGIIVDRGSVGIDSVQISPL